MKIFLNQLICKNSYGQKVDCVLHFLRRLALWYGQAYKVHETTTFLLVTLPNINRLKKISVADSAINLS